jgi:hypothetical protein
MVEEWKVPPFEQALAPHVVRGPVDFLGIARGDFPSGCVSAVWEAWGVRRSSTPGNAAPEWTGDGRADADRVRTLAWQPVEHWPTAPTGEQQVGPASAIAAGHIEIKGEPAVFVPTRAGLFLASREALAGRLGQPRDLQRTRDALAEFRATRTTWRFSNYRRDEAHNINAERFDAWLHLLACIARDRAAGVRFELPNRPNYTPDRQRIISHEAGVVCLEVDTAAAREWLTFRAVPVVPWAEGSALVPAMKPSRDPEDMWESTLEKHRACDWAENYAEMGIGADRRIKHEHSTLASNHARPHPVCCPRARSTVTDRWAAHRRGQHLRPDRHPVRQPRRLLRVGAVRLARSPRPVHVDRWHSARADRDRVRRELAADPLR